MNVGTSRGGDVSLISLVKEEREEIPLISPYSRGYSTGIWKFG